MITRTSVAILVFSTTSVYVTLLVAFSRKSVSKRWPLRFSGLVMGLLPAVFAIFPNRYWDASPKQILDILSYGLIFGTCWSLAFDAVDHYCARRTRSDLGDV